MSFVFIDLSQENMASCTYSGVPCKCIF